MSSEAVLRVIEEEAPQFPYFREYMAQNAGAGVLLRFESHPEMMEDLADHVAEYALRKFQPSPELLPTALALMSLKKRQSWWRPKFVPEWDKLQDEFEIEELRKLNWETADSRSPQPLSSAEFHATECVSREKALELTRTAKEGYEREELIRQIARHHADSDWLKAFLRELVLTGEDRTAALALDSLLKINGKREARDLAIHVFENRARDTDLLYRALRVLKGDQSEPAIAALLKLALDPFRYGSESAIETLARHRHNDPAVKALIYKRACRYQQVPQSRAALIALFWYYGDEPKALKIFEETATESNHPEVADIAFTALDCLRCSGGGTLRPLPVNRNDWAWRKDTDWLDSIALPDALERVYSRAFKAILEESRSSFDSVASTAAFRLALFYSDRGPVFERLLLTAASHGREAVRKNALKALFCRWPNRPEIHELLKETAARTARGEDRLLAIRMLSLVYPDDPDTLPLLEQIASPYTFDEYSSAAFSEYLRLRGCSPDALEWAITVLGSSKFNWEGAWQLFRCFGPRKSLLAAFLELVRSTTDLDLLNTIVAVLDSWAPTTVANIIPSRIADAADEKTQLKLLEGLGSSEEHMRVRIELCKTSPHLSVRLKTFDSLRAPPAVRVPLGLRLIEDAPLEAARLGDSLAFPDDYKESVAVKLVESYRSLSERENPSASVTIAMHRITGTLSSYYAETSAALEHFRAVALKTQDDREHQTCLTALALFYGNDPEVRGMIDQALPSGRLSQPVGILARVAATFDNPSGYLETIARSNFPLEVRIGAIRALIDQGDRGVEVTMDLIENGPPELKKEGLSWLRSFALNKGRLHSGVQKFLAKHGR